MRLAGTLLFMTSTALAAPDDAPAVGGGTDSRFRFGWSAPTGCPSRAEVLARAEQLIGHGLVPAADSPAVELSATVQPSAPSNWQLDVASGGVSRTVSAPTCDELGEAMALLIALSIDPDYSQRAASPPGAPGQARFSDVPIAEAPPALPVPARAPLRLPELAARRSTPTNVGGGPRVEGALGALGSVWLGRLPGVAPGVVLRGSLSRAPLVLAVELGFFPRQHVATQGGAGDLWLASLGGSLGYALLDGLLTPYAGLQLDLLHGTGSDISTPQSGHVWLLGLDVGLLLRVPVHRTLNLLMAGSLSALPTHGQFYLDPDQELFRPSSLGAQFGLGAEMTIR